MQQFEFASVRMSSMIAFMACRFGLGVSPLRCKSVDSTGSIVAGKQDARTGAISLGDDPNLMIVLHFVRREQSATVFQGVVVCLAVVFIEVSPITGVMSGNELGCCLTILFEQFQGSGRGDNLAESKKWFVVRGRFHDFLRFECRVDSPIEGAKELMLLDLDRRFFKTAGRRNRRIRVPVLSCSGTIK